MVAQQVLTIIRAKAAKVKTFLFEGEAADLLTCSQLAASVHGVLRRLTLSRAMRW